MAKKSAKSKGYRKTPEKKPYLTKRDIKLLCAFVAIIVIVVVAFALYDDGALKVEDGAIVGMEDNWLVANGGTSQRPRYYKLGEAGELSGYSMDSSFASDASLIRDIYYYPEAEDNPVDYVSMGASQVKAAELAETVSTTLSGIEGCEVSEVRTGESNGLGYTYYGYTLQYTSTDPSEAEDDAAAEATAVPDGEADTSGEAADAADAEPNRFSQAVNGYIEADRDSCIIIHAVNEVDSPDDYLPEDDLIAVLEQAVAAVTLEP